MLLRQIVFSYLFYSAVMVAHFRNPAMYFLQVLFLPFSAAGIMPKAQVAVDLLISSHAASYYGLRCSQAEGAHKQAKTRFSG